MSAIDFDKLKAILDEVDKVKTILADAKAAYELADKEYHKIVDTAKALYAHFHDSIAAIAPSIVPSKPREL